MPNSAQTTTTKIKLNLLYNQGVPQKVIVRILKWLTQYGRYVIVAVDILIIAAFLYRFSLDYTLSNINRRINTQLQFIESLQTDELKIRQFEKRLDLINKNYENFPKYDKFFKIVSAKIPKSITLSSINFEQTESSGATAFKIVGTTDTNADLINFIQTLKKEFSNVSLNSISYIEGEFSFSIGGTIN